MKTKETDYQIQANDFATKHGVKMVVLDTEYGKHFDDDRDNRYIFKIKLSRNGKSYTFKFGQSIVGGDKEPTFYDIFTCLQKHDVGSFEDFCGEFGYDTDSRKAERSYNAVCKEYKGVERLFGDVIEEMQEIQ